MSSNSARCANKHGLLIHNYFRVTFHLSWSHAGHHGCMPLPRSKQVKQAKPAPERPETQKDKGDKLKDAMQWLHVDPENRKILQAEWKFDIPYHTIHFCL